MVFLPRTSGATQTARAAKEVAGAGQVTPKEDLARRGSISVHCVGRG